ncbi:unnamed protein product [Linum trigynum]|uniref:Helicase protein MOM1 n=2 Tax=Linum trigynum TaxID=586398 RepID=A0AAV2D407_9ROSI
MAIETRTGRGSKVEESSSPKRTPNSKASAIPGSATPSASGLRRSERSSKKDTIPSPPSTRKSGRLQKPSPTPPTRGKKKIGATVKKNTLSPLRCSARSKKQSSPSSSVSKNSTSSLSSLAIPKKEKSMVQLTLESKEVSSCEGELSKARHRLSSSAYKAFFKKQRKAAVQRKVPVDVDSESIPTPEAITEQLNDVSERLEHLEPGDTILAETITDDNNSLSKRKRNEVNLDAEHAMVSNKDASIFLPVAVALQDHSQENCVLDTCAMEVKRQRVDNDGKEQELCSLNKQSNEDGISVPKENAGKEACPITTQGASEPCSDKLQDVPIVIGLKVDSGQNVCHACKRGGKLLCCDGKSCEKSYHLCCVHPPFLDVPLGIWHCAACTKKKVESGVQAVADGVESIWESREVELPDLNGLLKKKEFFVKYKGLAHVHNQWVPETQLLSEAPSLVANFYQKNKVKWRKEWATPHRLLGKRPVVLPKQKRGDTEALSCHHEWLVKWCGLDYEHVTWELESASFMNTMEVQSLMRDYEARHEKANTDHSSSEMNKKVATAEGSLANVACLPAGLPTGLDCNHLDVVNNLRDYWLKGTNAVIVDDQERIVKVISFILSLTSTVSLPFLIITTPSALDSWDEDFTRFAGCIYTVVYNGKKDVRRRIRSLEFGEGGCVMFQVLITTLEVVMEDLNDLRSNKWEAVIVDEYQRSKIHMQSEQIKALMTEMRILLVNCELKDCILGEHLLSLLASTSASVISEPASNSSPKSVNVKEKLSKYIANSCKSDCKSDSSRFVEYWVPVEISSMQLEQYCATLLLKSLFLSASSKTDNVGALRDVLVATRKCCDHPNLMVDIPPPPPPAVDALDFGIKASGKLQLLDTMLIEIRNRGLRVLILFQSIGDSAKVKIGDILDDMVRQRFGENSYERVDGNVQSSRKYTALQNFNNEKQRFVFLLETRACASSIKLTSVDVVIIFGSDWSPANDIKNLQKITLDSQCEQIMTFRLYSCFTVEEKVLMLAREEKTRDTKLPNINRTTSHLLLKWGASHLFRKLHEFHSRDDQSFSNNSLSESSHSKDVVDNFFAILAKKEYDASNFFILKVKQIHGNYICNSLLPGEKVLQCTNEEPTHLFWKNLLGGKEPQWKYLSHPSQRSRKRGHYPDVTKIVEADFDAVKKRKKTVSCAEPNSSKPVTMEGNIGRKREGSSGASLPTTIYGLGSVRSACNLSEEHESNTGKFNVDAALHNSQNSLHCNLKPKIERLCEVLQLPDDIKSVVESFLEYVMNNHNVSQESEAILQAFQIALCWTAASMRKYKIDHKESLLLAKERLNFECKKEEADYRYSMLRCLKKVFLYRTESLKIPSSAESSQLLSKCVYDDHTSSSRSISSEPHKQKDGVQLQTDSQEFIRSSVFQQSLGLAHQDLSRSIKDIYKKCDKLMRKLLEQQAKEKEEFLRKYKDDKAELERKQKTDAAVIRCHSHGSMRADKLKSLEAEYAKKFVELEKKRVACLNNLEAMQSATRKKLEERKVKWVEGVEAWAKEELMPRLPPNETGQTPGMAVSFNVHPKEFPGVRGMSDRQKPSNICEVVNLSDDEEEITQLVEPAVGVIPETALTRHVEIAPGGVTPGMSASCGARVVEQEGGILSAASERLMADQLKDNSSAQLQVEQSNVNGREKAGVGATNLSHTAGAHLQRELVKEVPESAKSNLVESERLVADQILKDNSSQLQAEESDANGREKAGVVAANLSHTAGVQGELVSEVLERANNSLVVESERLVADQLLKDIRLPQQESDVNGREKGGVEATNLSHTAGAHLQGELVSEVPERADCSLLVDNAHRETEDGNITRIEKSKGSVEHHGSMMPAEVPNVCSEDVHVDTTVAFDESIDKLRLCVVESSPGIMVEQRDRVSPVVPDTAATNASNVGDLPRVINGASTNILDSYQKDGSRMQDIAASTPANRDARVELSGENLPPLTMLTETCSAGDSVKNASSGEVNQQESMGVSNMSVEVANGSSTLHGKDTTEAHNSNQQQPCDIVDSLCAAAEGEVLQPDAGAHETTVATEVMVSPGEINDVISAEILDNQNDEVIVGDIAARISTSQDDNSQETLLTNSASVHDGVIPGVPDTDTRDLVNVGDSCRENNGSSAGGDQECVSSEEGTAVGQQDRTVIPPALGTASTERMDLGNSPRENDHVSTELDNETVGILVQDVSASTSNRDDGSEKSPLTNSTSVPPIPETVSAKRMDGGDSCGENGHVSTQHENEAVGIFVQNVPGSTSNRDDCSEEMLLTNSTSIQQPEAASAQVSQFLNQPVQNEAALQPAASTRANVSETLAAAPSTSAIGARILQATPVYRVPLPLGHDPLQNELDRIRRELDHIANVHEKEKMQLKSDCEKEIEEVVAQIRNKYEVKMKEKEKEIMLSKRELDANHNKILMNKILAEAFRSKCMDIRACNSPGVLQDAAATFMQQFRQMASMPPQGYSGPRSSAAPSSRPLPPPGVLTGDSRQTASALPSPSSTTTSRAQAVFHHSTSQPLSSSQSRPPTINSMSIPATTGTATNHLHIDSQNRAPAPHLQALRPTAASMAPPVTTNIPHGMMHPPSQRVSTVLPSLTVLPPHPHQPEAAANPVQQNNDVVCLSDDD